MQLKKLEMCGFKSFADKTEIAFEPGVTCIVGPNGCGKSNVVDAIKWVLGTLSYKSVRGEEMLDVIFKGAEGVGPAGMAEVSLTLDNADRTLPIEFEEVTITRRLHATGEGEYLINGSACRLKDIRDLLYGTGIGADNYSIIEQGKIDRLVTSDPRQRRLVFDEAAGISKYRARKKETEGRLEKVTQDLLRLNDIVREVQRELRSVRSQAGRASRYRELQADHRAKRIRLLVHDARGLRDRGREVSDRIARLDSERAGRDAETAAVRTRLEGMEQDLAALADRHASLTSELSAASSRAGYFEQALAAARQRLEELEEGRARAGQDRASAAAMLADKQARLEEAAREREGILADLRVLETRVADAEAAAEDGARECRRVADSIESKKAEAVDRAQREARYRNDLAQVKAESEALAGRAVRAVEAERRVSAELDDLRGRREAALGQRTALDAEIADLKRGIAGGEAEQARLKEELVRLDGELIQLRAAKERSESRRETLRELEVGLEGLGEGARRLLRDRLPGLVGTVADLVETSPEDVAAVEAVLGENAGAILFETHEQALEALRHLRANDLPRTTVLSLERCAAAIEDGIPAPGLLPRTSERIRMEERFRPVAEALLGGALVVESEEDAEGLRSPAGIPRVFVTRSGEVFDARGLTSVGKRGAGLLSRKAELKALEQEIGRYLELIESRDRERAAAAERQAALEQELAGRRHGVYERSIALGEIAAQLDQHEKRIAVLGEERDHLAAEQRQTAAQVAALAEKSGRLETLVGEVARLREQIEIEIREIAETLRGYEEARARLQQTLTQIQVDRATSEEKRQSVDGRIEMIRTQMEQHRETVRRSEEHLAQIAARMAAANQDLERQQAEQAAVLREIDEKRGQVEGALAEREKAQAAASAARESLSGLERAASAAAAEMQGLKVQEAQQATMLDNLAARGRDEFQVELEPALAEAPAEGDAATDWDALGREADDLRARIASFGAVNTAALDMIGELEGREKDLLGQQRDIESAKRQLEDLIRRINRESKELFERTLEFVREQFSGIFRKVFGGGKADIVLQEEEGVDPFDQGLEVMVRIPQRELMPISSLSGGQKSLTAFSLVMALFKANPSPFCVLDEADAALDEANVDKYSALVNEFVHETQFIVITHNKRTMAAADILYGVTMETPGVSRKVSVDLNGDEGLESLKKRREELLRSRAGAAARKAAEMADVRAAAEAALEAGEAEVATATAEAPESASG
jgi:chromosome segregation protein